MKRTYLLIAVSLLFFLIACGQNGNEPEESEEESADETAEEGETQESETNEEQSSPSEEANEKEQHIKEEILDSGFIVYGHRDFERSEELLAFSFQRSDQQLPLEERLLDSLKESAETDKLAELEQIAVDGTAASLYFTENEQLQSMASAEQLYFTDMLHAISSLYGIETLEFYTGNEPGIEFGQTGTVERLDVEAPENRGFYVYGDIDGMRTYISGVSAEEIMTDEAGDLMDFPETVNKMKTVKDNSSYQPGIGAGIEIIDVTVNDAAAEVHYNLAEDQADITDFENVLQLTALDFGFQELHLINQEEGQASIFLFDPAE